MHLTFKETKEEVYAAQRVSKHVSPHLHNALEIVCVTEGTLEMGVGQELYHMEKGDIGFVFSDIIHHYQVFSEKTSRADYILVPSSFAGVFKDKIQGYALNIRLFVRGRLNQMFIMQFRRLSKWKKTNYDCSSLCSNCAGKMYRKMELEEKVVWEVMT